MPTIEQGQWLQQYVAPQLLREYKNYKDDFIGAMKGAPASAVTADGIRFNRLNSDVGFFVNNTSDFTAQKMNGDKVFVEWEKYDTDPTEVDDAEIRYLAYDKRAEVRIKHTEAFKTGIRDHILHKLAPSDDSNAEMPVMRTTGEAINGRKRMSFEDAAAFLEKVKKLNLPDEKEFYLVLCPEHTTDLILDKNMSKFFASSQVMFDMSTGKVRSIMGFKFFENNAILAYNQNGEKKPKGAVMGASDRYASLFFYAPNTVYHIEKTKILYSPETQDTKSANPKSVFRTQTYGLIDRITDYGFGAIVSGIA